MMRMIISILVVLLSTQPGLAKKNDCDADLSLSSQLSLFTARSYDMFGSERHVVQVNFTVSLDKDRCDGLAVGFSSSGERNGERRLKRGSSKITYWVSKDQYGDTRLQDLPGARSDQLLILPIGSNDRRVSGTFYVVVPGGQSAKPGDYKNKLTVSLYEGTSSRSDRLDRVRVTLNGDIEPVISAQLSVNGLSVPLGQLAPVIDFGMMEEGQSKSFDMRVRANTPYRIRISSSNRGMLKLVGGGTAPGFADSVEYRLSASGQSQVLSSTMTLNSSQVSGSAIDENIRMQATITQADAALAGDYQDELTISIEAR